MTSPPLDVGIVLAAGGGTRFGRPKAGVELDGEPLAARAARALREGGCDRVAVVLGPEQVAVDGVDAIVVNADWAEGLGSSLRAGLRAAEAVGSDAERAVIVLCDEPGIGAAVVRHVRATAPSGPLALAAATFDGRRGHPVVLGARRWREVAALAVGDVGARPYLQAHEQELVLVACDGLGEPGDIDHPDDLPT